MERDVLDVEPAEQLGREVEPGGRRGGRAGLVGVDRLVAPGVGERLRDVRRQRRLAGRLAVEPQQPAALAEVLEQLDRPVAPTGAEPPRRPRERPPRRRSRRLRSSSSTSPRGRVDRDPRGDDTRVVRDHELAPRELLGELREAPVPHLAGRPLVDEQARVVAPLERPLRDQLGRQLVVELGNLHPSGGHGTFRLWTRPQSSARRSVWPRPPRDASSPSDVQATLERAREQIEALADLAAQIESSLPGRVSDAVREGLKAEAHPGRPPHRRGARARRPDDPPARADGGRPPRRAPRPPRRPRAARRPDHVRLEGRRRPPRQARGAPRGEQGRDRLPHRRAPQLRATRQSTCASR